MYWPIHPIPSLYGIAVGCFADANFPPPNFELNTKYRHPHVKKLEIADSFDEFGPAEKMLPRR